MGCRAMDTEWESGGVGWLPVNVRFKKCPMSNVEGMNRRAMSV
jgi:hypothetical protein